MSEKEEGGNQAFEVIPLFFFDLIARVVPGLFLLFGISWICGKEAFKVAIGYSLPEKALDSTGSLIFAGLLAGYIVGHLMSPLVKALDNWHKNEDKGLRHFFKRLRFPSRKTQHPPAERKRWRLSLKQLWDPSPPTAQTQPAPTAQTQPPPTALTQSPAKGVPSKYDELRLRCPQITNILMRIRAEYIMYGGFCIAFLIDVLLFCAIKLRHGGFHSFHSFQILFQVLALFGGAFLMFKRNQETIRTFNSAVENFYDAATVAGKLKPETGA